MDYVPPKEFWRVMDKSTMKIVCVDKIDPDATLHPAGGKWEPDGVHKWLPFVKGCGCHALNELTKKEREDIELVETASERRANKEAKRADRKAEQDERDEYERTPAGEKAAIIDTKVEAFIPEEMPEETNGEINNENATSIIEETLVWLKEEAQEDTTELVIKKRGRPAKK